MKRVTAGGRACGKPLRASRKAGPRSTARISLAATRTRQLDRLVAQHAGPDVDVVVGQHPVFHVPLQPGHERHAALVQVMQPLEVQIRAVGHHHAAGRKRPRAGHRDVARLAVGDAEETRQMSRLVQADMQLGGALRAPERRPRKRRQAQVDGRRINGIYSWFLNPKPWCGARCWQRASRRPKSAS